MTTFKKILLALSLMGTLFNSVWAVNSEFYFSVSPVAENVYSIISPYYGRPSPENKGWNSNSHFIVTEKSVLVFDTGSSELIGNEILKAIKSITDKPVRWVVNSHSHADHWLGNIAFANAGAEIISTSSAIITMKQDGKSDVNAFFRMTEGETGSTHIAYPTSFIKQTEKRNFGGVDVEFIISNDGHSPGDILMWLPKQKIIFGGDVLSSDWMPIMTPRGNVPNLIDTLNVVIELNPDIVLPGHGKVTNMKSVKRDVQFLTSVWQQIKESRDNGKTSSDILSQIINKFEQDYRELYRDFDSSIEYLVQMIVEKQMM